MTEFNGAVAIVYFNAEERLYAVVRSDRGTALPGGGMEPKDENVEATIRREIEEELGIKKEDYILKETNLIEEFTYGENKGARSGKATKRAVFLVELLTKNFNPKCPEIIEAKLCTTEEVKKQLTWNNAKVIFDTAINLI